MGEGVTRLQSLGRREAAGGGRSVVGPVVEPFLPHGTQHAGRRRRLVVSTRRVLPPIVALVGVVLLVGEIEVVLGLREV